MLKKFLNLIFVLQKIGTVFHFVEEKFAPPLDYFDTTSIKSFVVNWKGLISYFYVVQQVICPKR
jgi:hypothetical protein